MSSFVHIKWSSDLVFENRTFSGRVPSAFVAGATATADGAAATAWAATEATAACIDRGAAWAMAWAWWTRGWAWADGAANPEVKTNKPTAMRIWFALNVSTLMADNYWSNKMSFFLWFHLIASRLCLLTLSPQNDATAQLLVSGTSSPLRRSLSQLSKPPTTPAPSW